ncbi:hypothetical protein BHE74_00054456 [Ensete ventricosum]|nr:hypothetical protein BHE74_00054456 [Ensete ventricosum]
MRFAQRLYRSNPVLSHTHLLVRSVVALCAFRLIGEFLTACPEQAFSSLSNSNKSHRTRLRATVLSNDSSLLSSSATVMTLFFSLSRGPLLLLCSRLLPPAMTSTDDTVQLCLSSASSADRINEIDTNLSTSSLLPLLVKLVEVADHG